MKTIDSSELVMAMEELEKEKGISKGYLLESLEAALVSAYKRNFNSAENVKIIINDKTGKIQIFTQKEVVEDPKKKMLEISMSDAKRYNKRVKIGDIIDIEIMPKDFGRIAAQTAKQVILQKIREAERDIVYSEYNSRKGEIVSGIVQKNERGTVILDLGKLEGIMIQRDQLPTETYKINEKVKAYVLNVEKGIKGLPQVFVSRACPGFVKKLFEFEIPEIYEGLIEIKNVSRDPGSRSKVAVYSKNEDIDPVGSCVGQKGIRIQNIINELKGEKIDVIEYSEDPATFISSALLPAQVLAVDIKEEEKFAQVIVPDNQLSLAIGKSGQNVRLAARLTTWKIDIKSESQFRALLEYNEKKKEEVLATEEISEDEPVEIVEDVKTSKIEEPERIEEPEKIEKQVKTKKAKKVETTKTEKVPKEEKAKKTVSKKTAKKKETKTTVNTTKKKTTTKIPKTKDKKVKKES